MDTLRRLGTKLRNLWKDFKEVKQMGIRIYNKEEKRYLSDEVTNRLLEIVLPDEYEVRHTLI